MQIRVPNCVDTREWPNSNMRPSGCNACVTNRKVNTSVWVLDKDLHCCSKRDCWLVWCRPKRPLKIKNEDGLKDKDWTIWKWWLIPQDKVEPWRTRTGGSNPDARLWLITLCFLSRNSALICGPIAPLLYNLLPDTTLLSHREHAIQYNTTSYTQYHTNHLPTCLTVYSIW